MEVLTLSRSNIWRMVWDVSIKSVRFRHSDLENVVREGQFISNEDSMVRGFDECERLCFVGQKTRGVIITHTIHVWYIYPAFTIQINNPCR